MFSVLFPQKRKERDGDRDRERERERERKERETDPSTWEAKDSKFQVSLNSTKENNNK
jgi:hypothetical protein